MKTLAPCPVTTDRKGNPYYVWGDTVVPPSTADLYAAHKRFETGEVAAECWHFMAIHRSGHGLKERYDALERFATHPDAGRTDYR